MVTLTVLASAFVTSTLLLVCVTDIVAVDRLHSVAAAARNAPRPRNLTLTRPGWRVAVVVMVTAVLNRRQTWSAQGRL